MEKGLCPPVLLPSHKPLTTSCLSLTKPQPRHTSHLSNIPTGKAPISVDEVEDAADIMKRFCTGGMSLGAISREVRVGFLWGGCCDLHIFCCFFWLRCDPDCRLPFPVPGHASVACLHVYFIMQKRALTLLPCGRCSLALRTRRHD